MTLDLDDGTSEAAIIWRVIYPKGKHRKSNSRRIFPLFPRESTRRSAWYEGDAWNNL